MRKKILSLGRDGKPHLRLPNGRTEDLPLSRPRLSHVFLLIDCSSSMEGTKLTHAQKGGRDFAGKAVSNNYAVGLISFATAAELLGKPSVSLAELEAQLLRIRAQGSTNMTAAIELAIENLSSWNGKRAIVLATDGSPDSSETALSAAERAKALQIDIITIGTDDADKGFLRKLASRSDLAIEVSDEMLAGGISVAAKMLTP